MIRFSGFSIDENRAELRRDDGTPIRIRPKTYEMLRLLASNNGRVLSKQELMDAIWPDVHVSDDSLFQCIKELRSALGDADRQLIKVVSGRGYMLDAEVTDDARQAEHPSLPTPEATFPLRKRGAHGRLVAAFVAAFAVLAMLAIGLPALLFAPGPSTIAVMPVIDASGDSAGAAMSTAIAEGLVDGLAQIDGLQVVALMAGSANASLTIASELDRSGGRWILKARLIETGTGQVHSVARAEVEDGAGDQNLQQTRLVAGLGDQVARSLNLLLETPVSNSRPDASTASKAAIEQASASINQTSPERFAIAETMLTEALRAEPDNVDLQIALAGMQLRGLQMAWYGQDQRAEVEANAGALLGRALQERPRSMTALEARCRLLSAQTKFAESLVTCAQVLAFDPWNGSALYLVGLGQLYLGRFEDALATFTLADRYDTPPVSRWTWLLGAGWANLVLNRNAQALPWLERSVAITAASGRSHMLLAVAYYRLGRLDDAKAAMGRALQLRPNSTLANVLPTSPTMSPDFLASSARIVSELGKLGMPAD